MSLVIQTGGLKGAVPRLLKRAVEERLDDVGDALTPEEVECVRALQAAANKLIARSPQGLRVDVQLLFTDAPFGGRELAVAVTATRPRSR